MQTIIAILTLAGILVSVPLHCYDKAGTKISLPLLPIWAVWLGNGATLLWELSSVALAVLVVADTLSGFHLRITG